LPVIVVAARYLQMRHHVEQGCLPTGVTPTLGKHEVRHGARRKSFSVLCRDYHVRSGTESHLAQLQLIRGNVL
jgi:hypothetical protein